MYSLRLMRIVDIKPVSRPRGEPAWSGYLLTVACPCGVVLERWVTPEHAELDLPHVMSLNELGRRHHEPENLDVRGLPPSVVASDARNNSARSVRRPSLAYPSLVNDSTSMNITARAGAHQAHVTKTQRRRIQVHPRCVALSATAVPPGLPRCDETVVDAVAIEIT